jgi:hypothetical protein
MVGESKMLSWTYAASLALRLTRSLLSTGRGSVLMPSRIRRFHTFDSSWISAIKVITLAVLRCLMEHEVCLTG